MTDRLENIIDIILDDIPRPTLVIPITARDVMDTLDDMVRLQKCIRQVPFHHRLNRKPWERRS